MDGDEEFVHFSAVDPIILIVLEQPQYLLGTEFHTCVIHLFSENVGAC